MLSLLLTASLANAAFPAAPAPLTPFTLHRPAAVTYTLSDAPLPDPGGPVSDRDGKRYVRHLGLANAGLITLGVGAGVTTLSAVVLVGGALNNDLAPVVLGTAGVLVGTIGSYVGQAIFSIGGLEAAYDLKHIGRNGPVVLGWVTCGMMAGGIVTYLADSALTLSSLDSAATDSTELSPLSITSTVLTTGALIPGFITYFNVRSEGVDLRASVVPTVVPVRLANGDVQTVPGVALVATF